MTSTVGSDPGRWSGTPAVGRGLKREKRRRREHGVAMYGMLRTAIVRSIAKYESVDVEVDDDPRVVPDEVGVKRR